MKIENQPFSRLLSCVFKSSVYFRRKGGFAVNFFEDGLGG
jgi:hypothetical protein